ncbi:hypothetical protein C1637_11475 [Chryseobacterium lactis]|uniref:RHS repeat protein n=1 Tax=Chryseobacterium lactis TaxID=1241981 RepID=A0A3G6RPS2_CHRLC|nr:hypothetical protein [Chryseobacterium lactis]AZA80841.1 hypothetical protein EG342_02465 [Chryseobacterium lactis]AZB05843.1 hypothetical protein EG341_18590 [Chryseobacterium lactis]PNW13437.1 hypothetical protein C1637_11475 [Chryseobacterium lactis]
MKKIFLLLISFLISNTFYSQNSAFNAGVTQPVPTASSLATYNNNPVSIQTGIPNISYPLFNIPTNNKLVNISLGLNYHAGNTFLDQWTSNVGKGWSMLGQGVISREVIGDFDESFNSSIFSPQYKKNAYNDIYNFSIPGESGKFKIKKDSITNTFEIVKLSDYTSIIKINRPLNISGLLVDSYTITNSLGITYEFKTYDISPMRVLAGINPNTGNIYADLTYRSAYYLTSIIDENNKEIVKYNYLNNITYVIGHPTTVESENHRLSSIEIKDKGTITINYSEKAGIDNKNDKFGIDNIVLKNSDNLFIKKYTFEYSYPVYRNLNSFSQVNSTGEIIEKYKFDYKDLFSGIENDIINSNVLHRVHLPSGGAIEYNFDLPPYYYTIVNTKPGLGDLYDDVSFTNSEGKKFFLTINEPKEITIDASDVGVLNGRSWGINIYKKEGNSFQIAHVLGVLIGATDPDTEYNLIQVRNFQPGEYYIELFYAGIVHLQKPIVIHAFTMDGPPIKEEVKVELKGGVPRIKNIKYFDLAAANITTSSVASRIEEYDYNFFNDPTKSSQYFVDGGSVNDGMTAAAPSMLYKNVKVSQGNNTGYTKYYFRTPEEDTPAIGNFWPNYNLTRGGLPEKTEVYNASNQKVSEDIYDYTIQDFDGPEYYLSGGAFKVKTVWTKEDKVTSRNYFDSGVAETKKEVIKNANNYAPNLERVTSFDGSIQETTYQYALDKNNQKLITANMIGIPLETTSLVKKNASDAGKLIAKSETKYDNAANKLPSSALSYDSQNILASEVIFNQYDEKGNLEQYTTKDGLTVSIVWGYHKTQPIAKIEGAAYGQVAPYIADIVVKSDGDVNEATEKSFQEALDTFRNNSNLVSYQITTFVYDPLVGMKSMTPPSGIRELYKYDNANRLDQVVDENGKVLKKYKYNYKQ